MSVFARSGFPRIPWVVLKKILGSKCNLTETKILMAVVSISAGYRYQYAAVNVSELSRCLNLYRRSVRRSIRQLEVSGLLIRHVAGKKTYYGLRWVKEFYEEHPNVRKGLYYKGKTEVSVKEEKKVRLKAKQADKPITKVEYDKLERERIIAFQADQAKNQTDAGERTFRERGLLGKPEIGKMDPRHKIGTCIGEI